MPETTRIYRIQDKDGRGPWKPGFSHVWVEQRDDHANLMPSFIEFGQAHIQEIKLLKLHSGVGCLTVEQLKRWFTESEYRTLQLFGYNSVVIKADRLLEQSDRQCVFARSKPLRKSVTVFNLY